MNGIRPLYSISSLRKALRKTGGEVYVLVRLNSDADFWAKTSKASVLESLAQFPGSTEAEAFTQDGDIYVG